MVTGEFPAQWPVTRSFDVLLDLSLNKQTSKLSWDWWFETPSRSLWRQCNVDTVLGDHFHTIGKQVCRFPSLIMQYINLPQRWLLFKNISVYSVYCICKVYRNQIFISVDLLALNACIVSTNLIIYIYIYSGFITKINLSDLHFNIAW